MRTCIDIPDELFRSLKVNAALQGKSLRDHVIHLIERGRAVQLPSEAAPVQPRPVPPIPSITFHEPIDPKDLLLSNAQMNDLLDQDELSRYDRVMQKLDAQRGGA